MADPPTTIFTLDEALDKILAAVTAFARDRSIILDSLNAFEKVFVDFVASQQNYNTSVTTQISGLAGKTDSLNTSLSTRMDRLESGFADLSASIVAQGALVTSRLDSVDGKVSDLSALVEDMLQGLQGVATSALQQKEIDLLNALVVDVAPINRPTQIAGDPTSISALKQPLPAS